jgi:hypothetical protein
MSETVRYPEELTHTVTTTDGTPVVIRAIRPEDAERLIAFYERLSEHTAYQRFFTVMKRLPPDWARLLANVDYVRRLALIAEVQTPGLPELIAVARYEPTALAGTAEVAFVVQDGWQNKGLGTGQGALRTTPSETVPRNSPLIAPRPRAPTTITSASQSRAARTISSCGLPSTTRPVDVLPVRSREADRRQADGPPR